jgi:hypothetical protein
VLINLLLECPPFLLQLLLITLEFRYYEFDLLLLENIELQMTGVAAVLFYLTAQSTAPPHQ